MGRPVNELVYLKFWWSCGTSVWLFFEDDENDRLRGNTGFAYQVNPKLDETDWSVIRQWVDGCLQRHESVCTCRDPFELPGFQVIDCEARKLVTWDRKEGFAALSYVWGHPQPEADRTRHSSQTEADRTVLPNPAERVVEDAIACASKLNIPYLWVDRFCINQEDESGTKQRLLESMDKIYSAAKVTIINVSGHDASAGLPGVSETLRSPPQGRGILGSHKIVPVINPHDNIRRSKWATRGWTLQEGLLARRRLVFTDTRIYFQCTRIHRIEGLFAEFQSLKPFEDPRLQDISNPGADSQAFPKSVIGSVLSEFSMADICNEFTRRDLKTDEDALNACLGVFSRFWRSEWSREYQYCGLPFQGNSDTGFALSLLWKMCTYQYKEGLGDPTYSPRPSRRNWGPSWSWLAWRGYMGFGRERLYHPLKIEPWVDIKIPNRQEEQTILFTVGDYVEAIDEGGLHRGWLPCLKLSGWVATVRFKQCKDYCDDDYDKNVVCCSTLEQNEIGSGQILTPMWAKVLKDGEVSHSSRLLNVIVIADSPSRRRKQCLVIHYVPEGEADTYERMGTCELYYDWPEIKSVQNKTYLTVNEAGCWAGKNIRDLECVFKTITLI